MALYELEMLTSERVQELWGDIRPLVKESFESNEVGAMFSNPDDVLALAVTDMCAIFGGFYDKQLATVLVLQFNEQSGRKGADILAMGGSRLTEFKRNYWELILDWLRANDIQYLDAYANERIARIYKHKYGFTKSCVRVRMPLQEQQNG